MRTKYYKQLIFTNHAVDRMADRSISADAVWRVLQHPERTQREAKANTTRFIRTLDGRTYHIIGTYLPKERKTLIVSVWVRGENDRQPLVWQVITAPFRLLWWVVRSIMHI